MRDQGRTFSILSMTFLLSTIALFPACAKKGAILFEREGCIQCHRFQERGKNMPLDLTAVSRRRSDRWIRQQIKNPQKNNPDSRMPPFSHLSEIEIRSIIRYLKSE